MPKLRTFVESALCFVRFVREAKYLLLVYALAVLSFWVVSHSRSAPL